MPNQIFGPHKLKFLMGYMLKAKNRVPSLSFDIGAINSVLARFFPAGFYYKTFMWPAAMWMKYEHVIRHAAGLGKAADDHNDPDRYEKTHAHCDVLVAGGGAAGLMAALQAGRSGARVIIADEQNEFGGWLLGEADISIDDIHLHLTGLQKPVMSWRQCQTSPCCQEQLFLAIWTQII